MLFGELERKRIGKREREVLYKEQNGKCNYCGVELGMAYFHIDHKTPVARDGPNEFRNYQLICSPCNTRKGDMTDGEFRRKYKLTPARQAKGPPPDVIPQEHFQALTKEAVKRRKNKFVKRQRMSELKQAVVPVTELDDPLIADPVWLVSVDNWNRGQLVFKLSRLVNEKWRQALLNMGGHLSLTRYGPETFKFDGDRAIVNAPEHLVHDVIKYFESWLPKANQVYKRRIEQELQRQLEEQEARARVLRSVGL